MTLGEKIKEARKQCSLSQEQLSEKMAVSRSAVAKWETDKGLPDVDNLKLLSRILGVSVDYLLDDGENIDVAVIRETYSLSDYGKGNKNKKKNRVIREKFPDAEIHCLLAELKLKKSEKVIDNLLGFFTDASFGIPGVINSFKNSDKAFYLVEENSKQFIIMITDEFIETRPLSKPVTKDKFEIGEWKFTKCTYEI